MLVVHTAYPLEFIHWRAVLMIIMRFVTHRPPTDWVYFLCANSLVLSLTRALRPDFLHLCTYKSKTKHFDHSKFLMEDEITVDSSAGWFPSFCCSICKQTFCSIVVSQHRLKDYYFAGMWLSGDSVHRVSTANVWYVTSIAPRVLI